MVETVETANPNDARRMADVLRPLVGALEGSAKILQIAETQKVDIANRENQIEGMKAEATALDERLTQTRAEVAEVTAQLAAEKLRLTQGVQIERNAANEKIVAAKKSVTDAEDEARDARNRIAKALAADQDAANQRLADLEADIKARREKADADVAVAEARLKELNDAIEELKKRF